MGVKKERYYINLIGAGSGPGRGRGLDRGKRGRNPRNARVGGGIPIGGGGKRP